MARAAFVCRARNRAATTTRSTPAAATPTPPSSAASRAPEATSSSPARRPVRRPSRSYAAATQPPGYPLDDVPLAAPALPLLPPVARTASTARWGIIAADGGILPATTAAAARLPSRFLLLQRQVLRADENGVPQDCLPRPVRAAGHDRPGLRRRGPPDRIPPPPPARRALAAGAAASRASSGAPGRKLRRGLRAPRAAVPRALCHLGAHARGRRPERRRRHRAAGLLRRGQPERRRRRGRCGDPPFSTDCSSGSVYDGVSLAGFGAPFVYAPSDGCYWAQGAALSGWSCADKQDADLADLHRFVVRSRAPPAAPLARRRRCRHRQSAGIGPALRGRRPNGAVVHDACAEAGLVRRGLHIHAVPLQADLNAALRRPTPTPTLRCPTRRAASPRASAAFPSTRATGPTRPTRATSRRYALPGDAAAGTFRAAAWPASTGFVGAMEATTGPPIPHVLLGPRHASTAAGRAAGAARRAAARRAGSGRAGRHLRHHLRALRARVQHAFHPRQHYGTTGHGRRHAGGHGRGQRQQPRDRPHLAGHLHELHPRIYSMCPFYNPTNGACGQHREQRRPEGLRLLVHRGPSTAPTACAIACARARPPRHARRLVAPN